MYLELEAFLTPEEVAALRDIATTADFVDGVATAGGATHDVKHNEQMADDTAQPRLDRIVTEAFTRTPGAKAFARAARIRPPILSRYQPGMKYGMHLDAPIMGGAEALRSDLSMTIFLSDLESYDGGALVLDTDYGLIECRLPAGSAVLYDTRVWHEVEPVTRGERLAAVTWFQSRVRDPQNRMALYELELTLSELAAAAPESAATRRLKKTYFSLLKRWSEI